MKIGYDNKLLPNILHTEFLRINIEKVREGIVTSWQMEMMPNIYCYSKILIIQRLKNKAKILHHFCINVIGHFLWSLCTLNCTVLDADVSALPDMHPTSTTLYMHLQISNLVQTAVLGGTWFLSGWEMVEHVCFNKHNS